MMIMMEVNTDHTSTGDVLSAVPYGYATLVLAPRDTVVLTGVSELSLYEAWML